MYMLLKWETNDTTNESKPSTVHIDSYIYPVYQFLLFHHDFFTLLDCSMIITLSIDTISSLIVPVVLHDV